MVEQDQLSKVGSCWECGYSLRGLENRRCPECGRPFDPADERTMNMGGEVRRLARFLMKPPGWMTHVLTVLAVLMSLWAAAVPARRGSRAQILTNLVLLEEWDSHTAHELGAEMANIGSAQGRFLIAVCLWLAVGLAWIARRVARGVTVKRLAKQRAAPFSYWRRWLVTPVIFALTVIVCRSRLPVHAGFWLSKPWLDQAVKDAKALPSGASIKARWLGVYPPRSAPDMFVHCSPQMGETYVIIAPPDAGFVYVDNGQPPPMRPDWANSTLRHVTGNWYLVQVNRGGMTDD
jgi:hypothetical protein